jgi:predicted amidophosphoribosyltransferase
MSNKENLGWICPKCRKPVAPTEKTCPSCGKEQVDENSRDGRDVLLG